MIRKYKTWYSIMLTLLLLWSSNVLSSDKPDAQILIKNVNIFDGKNENLQMGQDVLIEANLIKKIGKSLKANKGAKLIDGGGRTLMPGLIESHGHLAIIDKLSNLKHHFTWVDIGNRMVPMAESWLMDGFTTVRDMGGPSMGLMRSINAGVIPGPRIYPSGAFLSQTSGHADIRERSDRHVTLAGVHDEHMARLGYVRVADGVDAVLTATRENLRNSATQIKIMAGGGNGSEFDPIDSKQYLPEEIEAAVRAAKDWDTYVAAHLFYPEQINRFIDAGGMSLEHAPAIDAKTMKKVVKMGVFLSMQMNGLSTELRDSPFNPPYARKGIIEIQKDSDKFVGLVKKYKPKMVFATDALGDIDTQTKQRRYEIYERARVFGNFETLKSATSVGGELALLTNRRNPYKEGKLGVVEKGAYADLLLVDGNPLKDISVIGAYSKWIEAPAPKTIETLRLIMKDGVIYKNTL